MNKLRVVLDTNVVVSAVLKLGGFEAQIVDLVARREITLYVSRAVQKEYEEVLARPKFTTIDPKRVSRFLDLLKAEATVVAPPNRVTESPDESDNRFLECAESAEADYLITGDKRHFPELWKSTRIVNAREFLRRRSVSSDA